MTSFYACNRPVRRVSGNTVIPLRVKGCALIDGRRCADQLIERDLVGLGERQEQLEVRPALSRLEPRERADRDTRRNREIGQGHVALLAQGAQPRPDRGEDLIK